jgi:hypothetical protein
MLEHKIEDAWSRPRSIAWRRSYARLTMVENSGSTPAVPFLARQRRLRGEFERGLAVARMRALGSSFYIQMRPALFKEEGDLAALVGDTAGAIDAYTRYLNLRTDPDPELQPQVDSVRMALDGLLKASR